LITSLFEAGAVLLTRATSQIHGRSALAEVIIDHLREGGGSVAAPQLVMQSGRLALDPFWHSDLGGPARPGRLALHDQSARPMTWPNMACSRRSERVMISLTSSSGRSVNAELQPPKRAPLLPTGPDTVLTETPTPAFSQARWR